MPTPRIPDAALDYWGRVFTAGGFLARGIDFQTFVLAPHVYVSTQRAELLAAADAAEHDLVEQVPDARLRDCRLVEPLHHHAYSHKPVRRA